MQSAKHYKYQDQISSHVVLCVKKDISLYLAHKHDFTPRESLYIFIQQE